jgi:hypothetical protein
MEQEFDIKAHPGILERRSTNRLVRATKVAGAGAVELHSKQRDYRMNRFLSSTAAVIAASMLLGGIGSADAATYSFSQINSDGKTTTSDPLSVVVTESGSDAVSFTFYNDVGTKTSISDDSAYTSSQIKSAETIESSEQLVTADSAVDVKFYDDLGQNSSITDIYLSGTGGLLNLPGKITDQSEGVSFSTGADPRNLPGGKSYDFIASVGADSNPPVRPNGVNAANEYVTWTFSLASGVTYKDVISAIDAGKLQIGLHVPGSSGGSSSFINNVQTPSVPLPASLWLMFGALGGLACLSRRGRPAKAP